MSYCTCSLWEVITVVGLIFIFWCLVLCIGMCIAVCCLLVDFNDSDCFVTACIIREAISSMQKANVGHLWRTRVDCNISLLGESTFTNYTRVRSRTNVFTLQGPLGYLAPSCQ